MKTIELTEYERTDVMNALTSMMHFHMKQADREEKAYHPIVAKRHIMTAEKYKKLLEKLE